MELKNAIEERRSIRKYKKDTIDNEIILNIIKEATHAPSAHNRQPWKFKIVSDEEKNKIANVLYDKYKDVKGHSAPNTANIIKEAPKLVVVYLDNDDKENRDMDLLSIGGMIDEILLLALEEGLDTLWVGNTNLINDEIKQITNVNLETISSIVFGYRDQNPNPRPRKDFAEVIIN